MIYPEIELTALLQKRLRKMNLIVGADVYFQSDPRLGDMSTSVAMKMAKKTQMAPEKLAEKITTGLKLPKYVRSVEIAKPGFINFKLSDEYLLEILAREFKLPIKKYCKPKKIVIEYSAPNIAKPFGVGHLRSTIIGDSVANAYAALGHKVTRINHIGDWGTQFGKLIYAYLKWGSKQSLEENPIKEMLDLYVRFHVEAELDPTIESKARYWFKKLEDGDEKAAAIWRRFSTWSLKEFNKMYRMLGVKFNEQKGESEYVKDVQKVIIELKKKGIITESQGAMVVRFGEGATPALLVKQDGASLYMTRDIVALKHRLTNMKADIVIYHVGSEQVLHFKQLFAIAERAGWANSDKMIYAPHGLMRLPEGKMSTRKGRIIALEKLVEEAVARAYAVIEKKNPRLSSAEKNSVARAVGIGAVKYNDLQNFRLTSITFDWDKMLTFEGNSAPYVQYAYARLRAISRKSATKPNLNKRLNDDERAVARKIAQLPGIIFNTANRQSPNILAQYVYELAGLFSSYYEKYQVIKSEPKIRRHRLAIISAGADVIKKSLNILGIESPEEI